MERTMTPRVILKDFTQFDWDGMAGCTRFGDGSEPKVWYGDILDIFGERDPRYSGLMIVIDGDGITFRQLSDDGMQLAEFNFSWMAKTYHFGEALVAGIVASYPSNIEKLVELYGFTKGCEIDEAWDADPTKE